MEHTELTFVHRTNISKRSLTQIDKEIISELYSKNLISINMWLYETDDIKNWNLLIEGDEIKNVSNYVKQFYNIFRESKQNDVLIYAKYLGHNSKLGLVKKSSVVKEIKKEDRIFYCLELTNVIEVDKSNFPLLETVIPYYSTVSKVDKGREKLLSIFYGEKLPHKLKNLSAKATELLCVEWLRSDFNSKYQIKYQLMPIGGNNSDIDFLGKMYNGKILASQITTSNNKKTISEKVDKLVKFKSDYKIMFAQSDDFQTNKIEYISIKKVWQDFKNSDYKELIDFLINN